MITCKASLFRNEINKCNNTGARMLDFLYNMTLKLLKDRIFDVSMSRFAIFFCSVIQDVIAQRYLIYKSLEVYSPARQRW